MNVEQVKWALETFGGVENIERINFDNGRTVFPQAMLKLEFDHTHALLITRDYKPGSGYIVDGVSDYAVLQAINFKTKKRVNPETMKEEDVIE